VIGLTRNAVALVLLGTTSLLAGAAAAQEPVWHEPSLGDQLLWFVLFDEFEYSSSNNGQDLAWDVEGWMGGNFNRVWLKTEGHSATSGADGAFEVQALYSRLIAPFWELQAGVRYDRDVSLSQSRAHAVVGLQGLAPYWFELEPAIFLSEDGDLSARFKGSRDLLVTQRLVLQPELEANFAASTVEDWGVGSGLVDMSLGVRLRYEFRREIAPYLGVNWLQKFGATADLARARQLAVADTAFLVGVRAWF
jgi:copper resistance protein B